ncbi:MAG: serine acetyltransferase [Verrucomicrobiales bacterium]|nr:serine acetyltransferase [Verrucomicrobiales bacterium]
MSCDLQNITHSLLQSYREVGGINHIDGTNLPSQKAIENFCGELLRLVFPGFLDESAVNPDSLEAETAERVFRVMTMLKDEIRRSLRFCETPPSALQEGSHRIACQFFHGLPEVRRLLQTDVDAAYDGDPAARSVEEIILSYPCIETLAVQRMAHVLYREKVPLLPRMMTEWAHRRTGIDIHPGAEIGSHFFIDHGTGVVIGETCVIGCHVKLYHGVTLGAKSFQKDADGNPVKGVKRHPRVEDFVTIYANATILGGDTLIGKGSTIGANVFLMESVPAYSTVGLKGDNHRIDIKAGPASKTLRA